MQSYDLQAHLNYWTLSVLEKKRYFQSQKERLLAKEKSSKDCQLTELQEEILTELTELHARGNTAQVNNFRPSKRLGKGLLDAQKKKNFSKMRNEITKANALNGAATEKQEELNKTLAKKFLSRKKIRYK